MGLSRNGGGNCVVEGGARSELRTITPPSSSPAETVRIAPENLEVANSYLACQSIQQVSLNLGLATDEISRILDRSEVRAYINNVFSDFGFNSKFKVRQVMDAIINKKLQEMDESDTGSGKDIVEILALSHKMSMDILDRQIKLEEAKAKAGGGIRNQTNVQINGGEATKYETLIQQLTKGG